MSRQNLIGGYERVHKRNYTFYISRSLILGLFHVSIYF